MGITFVSTRINKPEDVNLIQYPPRSSERLGGLPYLLCYGPGKRDLSY